MSSFDLTTEPWIPVRWHDGSADEVSLRTALTEAHAIREVFADSPLQTIALYRLLQALTLRIFLEPDGDRITADDVDRWYALYDRGHFDPAPIHAYFDAWQDEKERFDLLHPERPFYQHPEPMTSKETPVTKLFAAQASGNNPTLFDHAVDDGPHAVSLAEAARGLVATQALALGGGHSKPFYYSDAPLVAGAVFWIRGRSLFEALLINTPPTDDARMAPGSLPSWERDELPEPSARIEEGYLDYLTWPSRRVLLLTDTNEEGQHVVVAIKMSQGDKREAGGANDPLMAFKYSKKAGLYPLKLNKDRALWRDANIFMQVFSETTGGAPRTVEWATSELDKARWWVDVFGVVNDQAKIERWEHTRMPIYRTIVRDEARQHDLQRALERAEYQADILERATRECAAYLLASGKGYDDLGSQGRSDARELAKAIGAVPRFWTQVEEPFFEWLERLAAPDADPDLELARWTREIFQIARSAYQQATDSLGDSARHHRARVAGQGRLRPSASYKDLLATEPV